jgi:type 1 glutamine amidotransferase
MSFGTFQSVFEVAHAYRISVRSEDFVQPIPMPVDKGFRARLDFVLGHLDVRVSEAAICEFLIAPVLFEVWRPYSDALLLWSHVPFGTEAPLSGVPDYYLSCKGELGLVPDRPHVLVIEAKKDDFDAGWGQCLAAMLAAQRMNGQPAGVRYGCVSNGDDWSFGKLMGAAFHRKIRSSPCSTSPACSPPGTASSPRPGNRPWCPPPEPTSRFLARKDGCAVPLPRLLLAAFVLLLLALAPAGSRGADPFLVLEGGDGPGKGKHVVLVSGDEEYRSEEALPQLAKILAKHHGFKCTVLFAIDPKDGTINPNKNDNIPGLEALKTADLMVIFTRFRKLPDEQMKYVAEYVEAGKPIVGMRTATHAFLNDGSKEYRKYSNSSSVKGWEGGFGRQVLGEKWINHHGTHGSQSTRGILVKGEENHPILRGIKDGDIWGPTDVYAVRLPLPGDSKPLVLGQVLAGMKPTDPPVEGKKNDPMMPVAWIKTYSPSEGKTARVFTTTMGASQDLETEGTRRLLVNACYWAVGMQRQIPEKSKVDVVGNYKPLRFGFDGFKKGVKPADLLAE